MDGKSAGLTEVPRTKRHSQYHQEWNFGKGAVREAFQRVFSPDANYMLFQTIANQEAVDVLRQYMASREDMDTPLKKGLQFDNNLMDAYQRAIDKIAEEIIGRENYSHYPMVSTDGVHNLDRDPNAIFWPRIYIVNADEEEKLKGIIDNLSGDESFEVLRTLESPQFNQMPEIEILHNLGISPLVRLPDELRVGAQDLSKYVDFFAQMTETYKWTGQVIKVD